MNLLRLTIGILACAAAAPAFAQLTTQVDAVELSPDNIILPGSLNGTVTFKPCSGECEKDHRRARLTPTTEFYVDDRKVKFDAFRDGVTLIKGNENAFALISVDMETLTITSIRINDSQD